jgi:hypothetical protein
MKPIAIAAGAVALLASTVVALAVEHIGTITKIEWSLGTITLDDGNTYIVPPALQQNGTLAVGQKVKLSEEDKKVSAISKAG